MQVNNACRNAMPFSRTTINESNTNAETNSTKSSIESSVVVSIGQTTYTDEDFLEKADVFSKEMIDSVITTGDDGRKWSFNADKLADICSKYAQTKEEFEKYYSGDNLSRLMGALDDKFDSAINKITQELDRTISGGFFESVKAREIAKAYQNAPNKNHLNIYIKPTKKDIEDYENLKKYVNESFKGIVYATKKYFEEGGVNPSTDEEMSEFKKYIAKNTKEDMLTLDGLEETVKFSGQMNYQGEEFHKKLYKIFKNKDHDLLDALTKKILNAEETEEGVLDIVQAYIKKIEGLGFEK